MKQMKRKMIITYRWWRNDGKEINPSHVEALEETAMNRIKKMMEEWYTSGELCDIIHDSLDLKGRVYTGHWEVKKS